MTVEEKVKDLFDSYYYCLLQSDVTQRTYWAKQCALITVNEVINSMTVATSIHLPYWREVKQEIEKL